VINEPEWADKRYYDDRLNLVNGSVLVGQYLGGDREAVDFLFDRELKRIRREEIISLEFAPALLEQDF
jgi:hypothetical protein